MIEHDIKICTPYYNIIEQKTEQCIYDLLDSKEINCAWLAKTGTAIAATRNLLINNGHSDLEFQKLEDFTHYLFIDADIVLTVEDIKKILNYDLNIVSLAYKSRESEYSYVGGLFKKDSDGIIVDALKMKNDSEGLMEVDWVGAGALLIKKEVLERLPFPWFRYPILEKQKNGNKHCKLVFEDVGFCMLAKKYGYKIWLDCDTEVEHLARNYEIDNTNQLELLFRNVNDDINKMFQLIRRMSYKISQLEKEKDRDNG